MRIKQTRNKKMRSRILTAAMRELYPNLNLIDKDVIVTRGKETTYFVKGKESVTKPVYSAWLSEQAMQRAE